MKSWLKKDEILMHFDDKLAKYATKIISNSLTDTMFWCIIACLLEEPQGSAKLLLSISMPSSTGGEWNALLYSFAQNQEYETDHYTSVNSEVST